MPTTSTTKPPTYTVQEAGEKEFEWPTTPNGHYYLHRSNEDIQSEASLERRSELLFVTETGITTADNNKSQVFPSEVSWLRVTDHVVIENPAGNLRGVAESVLLADIGIVTGWLKNNNEPDETVVPAELTGWKKLYLPAFAELKKADSLSTSLRLQVLEGWAACVNWRSPRVCEVATTALYDFRNDPLRGELERTFKQHVETVGGNWQHIGPHADMCEPSSYYLGAATTEFIGLGAGMELDPASMSPSYEDKMFPVRLSSSKPVFAFQWPLQHSDSFYVVDSKRDAYIRFTPWSLQVFHLGYPVEPSQGFHFLKISEHVVLQMPARIPEESRYHEILRGLGMTIARVAVPDDLGKPITEAILKEFNDWARATLKLVPLCFSTSTADFALLILHFLGDWARHADWKNDGARDVVRALAQDLATSPLWPLIVDHIGKLKPNPVGGFQGITTFTQALEPNPYKGKKNRGPMYSLGNAYIPAKAATLMKEIERRVSNARQGRQQIDFPRWTVLANSQTDRELAEYVSGLQRDFPQLWDLKKHGLA